MSINPRPFAHCRIGLAGIAAAMVGACGSTELRLPSCWQARELKQGSTFRGTVLILGGDDTRPSMFPLSCDGGVVTDLPEGFTLPTPRGAPFSEPSERRFLRRMSLARWRASHSIGRASNSNKSFMCGQLRQVGFVRMAANHIREAQTCRSDFLSISDRLVFFPKSSRSAFLPIPDICGRRITSPPQPHFSAGFGACRTSISRHLYPGRFPSKVGLLKPVPGFQIADGRSGMHCAYMEHATLVGFYPEPCRQRCLQVKSLPR